MKYNVNLLCTAQRLVLALVITMLFGSCASSSANRATSVSPARHDGHTAKSITLMVQPSGSSTSATLSQYALLAKYLEKSTGKHFRVKTMPSYLEYWNQVRLPDSYELAIDAAHFTDYRVSRYHFQLLAMQQDLASYSLLSLKDSPIGSLHKLAGRSIAVRGLPSMDAIRLEAMFHDPSRQPRIMPIHDYHDGLELVDSGRADAVLIPSQFAFELSRLGQRYRIIAITEPLSPKAVTASPVLDPVLKRQIQRALLMAAADPMGRAALANAGLAYFIPVEQQAYTGYSNYLSAVWGFDNQPATGG